MNQFHPVVPGPYRQQGSGRKAWTSGVQVLLLLDTIPVLEMVTAPISPSCMIPGHIQGIYLDVGDQTYSPGGCWGIRCVLPSWLYCHQMHTLPECNDHMQLCSACPHVAHQGARLGPCWGPSPSSSLLGWPVPPELWRRMLCAGGNLGEPAPMFPHPALSCMLGCALKP